jgi:hypothetical protein
MATITVSDGLLARLQELARWSDTTIELTLEQAVREQYDQRFWPATNAGYAELRADPTAWADVQAERELLDGTLADGLPVEDHWTPKVGAVPS